MDQIQEVKEALKANATNTTIDELKARGRTKVRVVRAEQIAAMISEAVHRAVEESGLLSQEEHERLVERSREEFQSVIKQREQQVAEARRAGEELDRVKEANTALEQEKSGFEEQMTTFEQQLTEVKQELVAANQHAVELQQALEDMESKQGGGGGDSVSTELLFKLMNEIAEIKANVGTGGGAAAPVDASALTDALDKMAGNLNERLEKFGRKIGVSSAVEAEQVKFDTLFNQDIAEGLESNLGDVEVKKRTGSGIAGNLAKLKKLKGDG